ncbi:low molecular weight phosphotyrosine protein phosphatase [Bifidobacterium minimum]|uniref:Low molecular weight phosphotyrosine protein phosphatase n=1 Tax=Bifidobacterium minimum TaxID=1693 RepID=A0A087BSB7_9BIFI|nr:protein-tyrosine-phosphatase [Bifidobacterium minimum]KFI73917.1 low molecular weight phosphotyrosine protein phosphatase [Bifidobacterium minimum]
MRILVVCTGNVCRSPLGELLLKRYLEGTSIRVESAGTRGLPNHAIDPSSARLLDGVGIESQDFRSRRLTKDMVESADLVLCFERQQRRDIVSLVPASVRWIFILPEFAAMCRYCADHGSVVGRTIGERLISVAEQATLVRARIPPFEDVPDPYGRDFECFLRVANQINESLRTMLRSMRLGHRIRG